MGEGELASTLIAAVTETIAWAVRLLLNALIARVIVAVAVIVLAVAITIYALWIGAILWFATGRFGIIRSTRHRRSAELAIAAATITSLTARMVMEHRSPTNVAVITLFALSGAAAWKRRDDLVGALAEALRDSGGTPAD